MNERFWLNKKIGLLDDTFQHLRTAWSALLLSTDKSLPKQERRTFSDLDTYEQLSSARGILTIGRMAVSQYVANNPGVLTDILTPDFQFSTEMVEFNKEIILLLGFLAIPEGHPDLPDVRDPGVDFAIMKALFAAGRMLERTKVEGGKRSDLPTKAGRSKRKGYIDEQIYFKLLYSDKVRGKTRNAICVEIHKEAENREKARPKAKNEEPKGIKSVKSIRELLKPDLDKLFT